MLATFQVAFYLRFVSKRISFDRIYVLMKLTSRLKSKFETRFIRALNLDLSI